MVRECGPGHRVLHLLQSRLSSPGLLCSPSTHGPAVPGSLVRDRLGGGWGGHTVVRAEGTKLLSVLAQGGVNGFL